ncbi:GspH/FimT family pseudopilin [Alteromonas sp. CYL-A6]|uniref:GspH/FimT family pseudopilin n=1 Tax=Alteromonas nitratireducens TaxID=3390813 RepID=UPI0034B72F0F
MRSKNSGFTLIEGLVTVSIIAVLVAIGGPAVLRAQSSVVAAGAVEGSFFTLQKAKSDAIRSATNILVDFNTGDNWCMGITDQPDCDCTTANSCTVDGVESVLSGADFPGMTLDETTFADNQISFDRVRGLPVAGGGSFDMSDSDREVRISMNVIGRITVCTVSGELRNYSPCVP